MKMAGVTISLQEMLLGAIFDRVSWLQWSQTKAAHDGQPCPDLLLPVLLGQEQESRNRFMTFSDPAAFEAARAELVKKIEEKEKGGAAHE